MRIPKNFSWLIKNEIAGMAKPVSVVPEFEFLKENGIDAIVSLSELPLHKSIIEEFGFETKHIPITDLTSPTQEQIEEFIIFVNKIISAQRKVVVHCYLVNKGCSASDAILEVREKRTGSIETAEQEETVIKYEERLLKKRKN